MTKKKILVVNEFSQLSTGFSVYFQNVLPYLFKTGKYEIAELATYANASHPEAGKVPWKVYFNEPDQHDKDGWAKYNANRDNQFGKYRFEEVLLDFQPDYVLTIRDPWFDAFIEESPFRRFFRFIHMPTVDGEPQKPEWLDQYRKADTILTYTHWGKNILEKQTGGDIKVFGVASPGADLELFRPPESKADAKKKLGIDTDTFIIQTVMRNQPRKQYPELLKVFNSLLEKLSPEQAQKTFMYWHTTWPDVGWNIPEELRKYKLSHKVLFTYMCDRCNSFYPSFYCGQQHVCKYCKQGIARFPNTSVGLSRKNLAQVMSAADVYIQYSCSEGFGMPLNDAKALGVPILAVHSSAMAEQTTNGGGLPINVEKFFQEPMHQTNQLRSIPSNSHAVEQLYRIIVDDSLRAKLGKEARECVEKYYNWSDVANVWERAIDETPRSKFDWSDKPTMKQPRLPVPQGLNNEQFCKYICDHILYQPDFYVSPEMQYMLTCLNNGCEEVQGADGRPLRTPVDQQKVLNKYLGQLQHSNELEQYRYQLTNGLLPTKPEINFIEI